jgi:hypothetical protein
LENITKVLNFRGRKLFGRMNIARGAFAAKEKLRMKGAVLWKRHGSNHAGRSIL